MAFDQDPLTVVIVSDSFLIGDGLSALFSGVSDVQVIGRARHLDELPCLLEDIAPQATIICIRSQVVTTTAVVAAVRRLRVTYPRMGLVVISDRVDEFALDLLRGGSSGVAFLLDDQLPGIGDVLSALRELRLGQTVLDPSIVASLIRRGDSVGIDTLTPREVDILQEMAHGLSNRAIAEELHISVKSIEKGVTAIFLKLGPFNEGFSDRRVSSALVFLRSQTDPFGTASETVPRTTPIVLIKDQDLA
jgi:DNA-binding NarL/FixJ family response regulator